MNQYSVEADFQELLNNHSDFTNTVYAIVVIYHPDLEILDSLVQSTLPMVDKIVLVNNDLDSSVLNFQKKWEKEQRIKLLFMSNNIGLAAGINAGIKWATEQQCSHVLLLDQDSIPQENMVKHLLEVTYELELDGILVGAVGARHIDPRTGYQSSFKQQKYRFLAKEVQEKTTYVQVAYLQSSGSLIGVKALKILGLMDEGLFIHHIDQEWCLRASDRGFKSFGVSNALMEHIVGDKVVRIWLGYWRDIHLHSPARHYFAFRNSILLYKRKYIPFTWKIADIARLLFMFVFYSLFIPPRLNHASMMFRGLWDGILGKTGGL